MISNYIYLSSVVAAGPHKLGKTSVWQMVIDAAPLAQFVLLLLLVFSLLSWTIIVQKLRTFSIVKKKNKTFLDIYAHKGNLGNINIKAKHLLNCPYANIYSSGYGELASTLQISHLDEGVEHARDSKKLYLNNTDMIKRAMDRAIQHEVARFEKTITFLATTGSATPFIGLFGTVWGVMTAFQGIGAKGSASIAVVAPGISEALIVTAAGLAAAVPAAIFYNYFVNRIRVTANEMDDFSMDFLTLVEKNFLKK